MTRTKIKAVLAKRVMPLDAAEQEAYEIISITGSRTLPFDSGDKCVGDTVFPQAIDKFLAAHNLRYELTFKNK